MSGKTFCPYEVPKKCLMSSMDPHRCAIWPRDCEVCGFNVRVAEERKTIPLEERPDGTYGKILRKETNDDGFEECSN